MNAGPRAALQSTSLSIEGYFDGDGPDEEQFDSLGEARSVMIVPAGQDAGDVAFVVPVAVSAHNPLTGSVGELAGFVYAGEGDGRPAHAQVFDIREGVTSDNVTARVNLGPIAHGRDAGRLGARDPARRAGTDFPRKRDASDDRHGHNQGRRGRDRHHAVGKVFHSWACHGRMVATAVRLFCRQP